MASLFLSETEHGFVQSLNMELSDLIRSKRREHGFTQRSLAKAAGVSNSAVAQWENGDTVPTNEHMTTLKQLIGITPGVLVIDGAPYAGELVERPDELSLLAFWRGLSDAKRDAVYDVLNIGAASVGERKNRRTA